MADQTATLPAALMAASLAGSMVADWVDWMANQTAVHRGALMATSWVDWMAVQMVRG